MLPEYWHFIGLLKKSLPLLWSSLQSPDFDAWLLLRWTGQSLLISLLILAADYLTGAGLLSALRVRVVGRLRLVAALATGIAAQGLFVFWLGLGGLLTQRTVMAGGGMLAVAGLAALWQRREQQQYLVLAWQRMRPRRWWPALLLAPVFALCVADLMQPVAEGDSTMYHMAAARWYMAHQALPYHSEIRFNAQPHLTVLLYLRHWMVAGDDTLLKLFNLELALLLVAAVLAGLRELRVAHKSLALLVLASSPVFVWMMKIEYADAGLTAFLTAGGVLLLAALRRRSVALAGVAGVALAAAGAMKLQGLIVAAALLLAFLIAAWRERWPARALVLAMVSVGSLIVLWGAGWWLRSWLATGSPAYPFFSKSEHLTRLMEVNERYGFGRGLGALLMLPIRAVTVRPMYFADPYTFGPALLLIAAASGTLAWRRRLPRSLAFLGVALALFFGFWFFSGQVMRYWASTLGLQALWISAGLGVWLERYRAARLLIAGLGVCAIANVLTTSPTLLQGWPPPVTLSQKETVQAESLPYYRAVRTINQMAAPTDRVYAFCSEDTRFHITKPSGGDWFGDHSYFWLGQDSRGEVDVVARLRRAGYRFILFDRQRGKERADLFGPDVAQGEFLRHGGTPAGTRRVYDDGRYASYQILPD